MRVSALLFIALAALGPGEPREVWPRVLPVSGKALVTVEWRSDGKRLACFGQDNTLYVLDAASGKRVQRRHFRRPVNLVRWRPDWKRLAARRQDGRVQVRDVTRWKVVRTLRRKMPRGWDMEWSPDGNRLAVTEAGDDRPGEYDVKTHRDRLYTSNRNVVRIYEVATGKQKVVLRHRRVVGPVLGHDYLPVRRVLEPGRQAGRDLP